MRTNTKAAGLFAGHVAEVIRSADFSRCDWLTDTNAAAKLFRRAGQDNAGALSKAVYNAFGLDVTGPAAKVALRKVKLNRTRLSPKVLADLKEYERIAASVSRAKTVAFGTKKAARKAAKKALKITKAAAALVSALKVMGYGVKLSAK